MNHSQQGPDSASAESTTGQAPEDPKASATRSAAVGQALHDLTQAWKRLRMYPPGHPSRAEVIQRAHSGLVRATAGTELVVGVERDAFCLEDWRFGGPALNDLVLLLYRSNVAVVRLAPPIAQEDLERFISALGVDSGSGDAIRPEPGAALQFGSIFLEHADYASLVATEEASESQDVQPLSIWERLLRLQMHKIRLLGDLGSQGTGGLQQALQRVLAGLPREILRLDHEDPPEDLVQLIDLVTTAIREHTVEAVSRRQLLPLSEVDELLDSLPRSVALRALENALAGFIEEESDVLHFRALLEALEPRRVLRATRRMRDRGLRLSDEAVTQIAGVWFRTGDQRAESADLRATRAALEEQLERFDEVRRDGLRLPPTDELISVLAPAAGAAEVHRPSTEIPVGPIAPGMWSANLETVRATLDPSHQKLALLTAFTEHLGGAHEISIGAVTDRVLSLVGDLIESDHPMAVVAILQRLADARQSASPQRQGAIDGVRRALCGRATARRIVHALSGADDRLVGQLRSLVSALGSAMVEELVDYLAEEDDRSSRRRLLDFLAGFRSDMIPAARKRLLDPRWFVVRNMIGLLDEIDDRTSVPMLRQCALHSDLRVRAAALRVLGRIDRNLPEDLVSAVLDHDDAGFVERTLHLLGRVRCANAVEPMCELLTTKGRPRSTRLRTIEALGMIGDLRGLATVRQLLGALTLVPADERRMAFLSLTGYPPNDEVRALLSKGARARDTEIRRHCQRALERLGSAAEGRP